MSSGSFSPGQDEVDVTDVDTANMSSQRVEVLSREEARRMLEAADISYAAARGSRTPSDAGTNDDYFDDEYDAADDISLGFARPPDDPIVLQRNHFPSKLGGRPAWLDPMMLPLDAEQLKCAATGEPMKFLLQLYAPLDDGPPSAFHRMLYLFISPKGSRLAEAGTARAFRCQLPRENDFYPYEPPESSDRPTPLSGSAAAVPALRCARLADNVDDVDAKKCFKEHELVVEPEPEEGEEGQASATDKEIVGRLLHEYEEKVKEEKEVLGSEASKDGGGVDKLNPNEKDMAAYADFSNRMRRAPSQCIRYTFAKDSKPLWPSKDRQMESKDVPRCERCGSVRRFEFQVMPPCITYLGVDAADEEEPNFGTIAVYTCAASCSPLPKLHADGFVHDPSAAFPAKNACVGLRCKLEGLEGRKDLNGRYCRVLYWHTSSERWAIETEVTSAEAAGETAGAAWAAAPERLRVRSSNLRVAMKDGEVRLERDGGYAEEYVHVQTQ